MSTPDDNPMDERAVRTAIRRSILSNLDRRPVPDRGGSMSIPPTEAVLLPPADTGRRSRLAPVVVALAITAATVGGVSLAVIGGDSADDRVDVDESLASGAGASTNTSPTAPDSEKSPAGTISWWLSSEAPRDIDAGQESRRAATSDHFLILGGETPEGSDSAGYLLDFETDSWSPLLYSPFANLQGPAVVALPDRFIVAGGRKDGHRVRTVTVYEPATGSYTTMEPFPSEAAAVRVVAMESAAGDTVAVVVNEYSSTTGNGRVSSNDRTGRLLAFLDVNSGSWSAPVSLATEGDVRLEYDDLSSAMYILFTEGPSIEPQALGNASLVRLDAGAAQPVDVWSTQTGAPPFAMTLVDPSHLALRSDDPMRSDGYLVDILSLTEGAVVATHNLDNTSFPVTVCRGGMGVIGTTIYVYDCRGNVQTILANGDSSVMSHDTGLEITGASAVTYEGGVAWLVYDSNNTIRILKATFERS